MITKENIIHTVSIIKAYDNNSINIGTCFFFKRLTNEETNYFLISNAHILEGRDKFEFSITGFDKTGAMKMITNEFSANPVIHNEYDLAYININKIIKQSDMNEYNLYIQFIAESDVLKNFNEFSAIENIFSVGYPHALAGDNKMCPIIKHGITVTPIKRNFDNKEEFLIDILSFNGSSGSPVFLEKENQLLFVGIHRGHLTCEKINTGLGVCIRSNILMNFLPQ